MPKYDVWFTVRAPGGRTGLMETVSAPNKDAAKKRFKSLYPSQTLSHIERHSILRG